MKTNELESIVGGGISGTLINSIIKAFDRLLDFGRIVGSAIRYGKSGKKCNV